MKSNARGKNNANKKSLLRTFIVITLAIALIWVPVPGAPGGPGGFASGGILSGISIPGADAAYAAETPVPIQTRADLEAIAGAPDGNYVLVNDINLSGAPWTPIVGFTGTLDGAGHTISGMSITAPAKIAYVNAQTFPAIDNVYDDDEVTAYGIGLFANTGGAYIHDLTIAGASWNIEWSDDMSIVLAGALTGYSKGDEIRGVSVTSPNISFSAGSGTELAYAVGGAIGLVSGARPVSGISVIGGTMKTHRGDVTGEGFYYTGGVIGDSFDSVLVNLASATNVYHSASGDSFWSAGMVGGIAGGIYARNKLLFCLHNSYSRSNITYEDKGGVWSGEVCLGGIAGELIDSAVNNYYVPPAGGGITIIEPNEPDDSWYEHRAGILFGYATDANDTDVPYMIDRDYYYDIDGMPQVDGGWFEGDVEFTRITTPEALLAALNTGRPAVVAAYHSQYGETITLDKVFEWVIDPGKNDGWPIFKKVASAFVPVTNITGVQTTATAGTPLYITGTVNPANATNRTIVWGVKSAGQTGATISGNTLNTAAAGTVVVTARIANGLAATVDYTKDFSITVNPAKGDGGNIDKDKDGQSGDINKAVKVTGVKTMAKIYVVKGKSVKLPVAVRPYNATNKGVTWSVKNKKIAKINAKTGKLKALKTGKTVVSVTSNDGKKIAKCKVYVVAKAVALKGFKITPKKSVSLKVGKTLQIKTKLSPGKATGIVPKFKSGSPAVATVDAMGNITALTPGKTTIKVTAGKLKKSFVVNVRK